MEIELNQKVKHEIKTVHVMANVRYWEDAEVNGTDDEDGELIPCRDGENWCPVILIDTGVIRAWPIGTTADIHYKVCDQCTWWVSDETGKQVYGVDDDYVPKFLCPGGDGYGDYIIMKVDENGKIANWKFVMPSTDDE